MRARGSKRLQEAIARAEAMGHKLQLAPAPKKRKYGNHKVEKHGRVWDSKAELRRYEQLLTLEKVKLIEAIELQPRYVFVVNGVRIGSYKPDFRYWDCEHYREVVEDVKGVRTRDLGLRLKLMKAIYRVDVVLVGA